MKIIHTSSMEDWKAQRQHRVMASDIPRLMGRSAAAWEKLAREKTGNATGFGGNAHTRWGHEREPEIFAYAATFVDTRLEHNADPQWIAVHPEHERWGATPDGATPEGDLILEIKTTSKPLEDKPAQLRAYLDQIQWQLLVTGAEACALVWEEHQDFHQGSLHHEMIHPDKARQGEIVEAVEEFLGFLDGVIPSWLGEVSSLDEADRIARLAYDLYLVRNQIKGLKDRESGIQKALVDACGGSLSGTFGDLKVSVAKTKDSVRFDAQAFKKAHPDLHKEYTTKLVKGSTRVTITEMKEAA